MLVRLSALLSILILVVGCASPAAYMDRIKHKKEFDMLKGGEFLVYVEANPGFNRTSEETEKTEKEASEYLFKEILPEYTKKLEEIALKVSPEIKYSEASPDTVESLRSELFELQQFVDAEAKKKNVKAFFAVGLRDGRKLLVPDWIASAIYSGWDYVRAIMVVTEESSENADRFMAGLANIGSSGGYVSPSQTYIRWSAPHKLVQML